MNDSYLIVGGSSDIGIITANMLLNEGKDVTLLVRNDIRVEELKLKGASVIIGDALDEESLNKAIKHTLEKGNGKIAGIAHLVGSIKIKPPHVMTIDTFNEVISTNLTTAFLTLSLGGKIMLRNGGGRMVFISSVAGSLGLVNHEAIAAAKGGIESMVRSAAATYAKRGIRINAIAPGLTETRLSESLIKSDLIRDASEKMIPIKRINKPEEISKSINWLLTNAPDNITGQVLHLDGGMSKILV
ncbi:MAG: 2-deoxy-D-gluconate 3-dehydrogenase [Euryarchaeota archaeon]|nr:2-deoxy-D-gluconate 3-dehydrogenase [Euryarchaeota archaeon]|tara:strand:- start:130 stop:861 length:732 start_codon:yes stop_codon:yes gene_type:complete